MIIMKQGARYRNQAGDTLGTGHDPKTKRHRPTQTLHTKLLFVVASGSGISYH